MTIARRDIIDSEAVGVYHCITRCVRQAYLCGVDRSSGRSFEHRKEWIRARLAKLCEIFAVDLLAYSVMSTHLHELLRNRPDIAATWSNEEVARRWRRLFPKKPRSGSLSAEEEVKQIATNNELVNLYRARLCSVSWFQRCLSEYIARKANKEDDCTGRFWEGRFKSKRVNDLGGLVACMAYVDLNPLSAQAAPSLSLSGFTSIQDRIHGLSGIDGRPKLVTIEDASGDALSTKEYLLVLEETANILNRQQQDAPDEKLKVGRIALEILSKLRVNEGAWPDLVKGSFTQFKHSIGSEQSIRMFAVRLGRCWMHGTKAARRLFL